ncbi:hypothetical protein Arcve_1887 [Archaeoglobus veneficus SNP6]|uniref:Uncharacterized protein n=2 Tax=Archaeoglobus veneficus TaxID=58290 RepID=F2KRE6_ARCVS|nr:hypothetical protein Arcve_1887 [Archaeoglobus veneficus SNP6]
MALNENIIISTLRYLKSKIEGLHREGTIRYSTYVNLDRCCDELLSTLYLTKHSMEGEPSKIARLKKLIDKMFELKTIVECISSGVVDRSYDGYLRELLTRLRDVEELDLWTIKYGRNFSPFCYPSYESGELSFILVTPEKPNFLSSDLVGLLAHEVAHIHDIVDNYKNQVNKIKIGEALADILGHILVEFAFVHSLGYYIEKVVGLNNANQTKTCHPSWVARIWVLRALTGEIWQEQKIIKRNEDYLQSLLTRVPELDNLEEHLVKDCVREYRNNARNFVRFKFNEAILAKLEDLSDPEVENLGEVEKIIREAVLKNVQAV